MTTAAVVLAAGAGTRFAGPTSKLLADFRGRPLVSWAVSAAADATIGPVLVVAGAVDLSDALPEGVDVIVNEAWATGQASSLQAATSAAGRAGHDAIVVGLGDQPLVPASAWAAVASSVSPIAVATYDGRRRNPVRLARPVWSLLPTGGDRGARDLIADRPELVEAIPCAGTAIDIDTPEDLSEWS